RLRRRPYLKPRRFKTTTERLGLPPSRRPSSTKENSRTRLTLRLPSNGTIATACERSRCSASEIVTSNNRCQALFRPLPPLGSSADRSKELVFPEVLEPIGRQSRISNCGHDRAVGRDKPGSRGCHGRSLASLNPQACRSMCE